MCDKYNEFGWLYIATDLLKQNRWKVGITTNKNVRTRIHSTENIDYILVRAYRAPVKMDLRDLERYIHWRLKQYNRLNHMNSGHISEWFEGELSSVVVTAEHYIKNYFSGALDGTENEGMYDLLGYDIGEKPFESLIYDQIVFNGNIFEGPPFQEYESNPAISKFLDHACGEYKMHEYTMVDILSGNLNNSIQQSLNSFANERFQYWLRRQYDTDEHIRKEMYQHFLEEEKKMRKT